MGETEGANAMKEGEADEAADTIRGGEPPASEVVPVVIEEPIPPTVKKVSGLLAAPVIPALSLPKGRPTSPPAPPSPDKRRAPSFFAKSDARRWLDRYELISEIASGGMATVFLGRLVGAGGFQRLVAVKRLHGNLAADPEFVRMFIEEARLAAQIHHTNAVPIIEIGSGSGGYYLVMEYVEGVTLAQICGRVGASGLPVPRRIGLRIVLDALAGLHAAHELAGPGGKLLGLVHRDCSPGNILIGVDGNSRITDFGVARDSSALSHTRMGTIKGKLSYMAPEQVRARARLDRRADLFAMGVVLWEVLAGRRLFHADTRLDTLLRSLEEPVPRLGEVAYAVPEALDALCVKALARDPDERFQTAVEMADAIEQSGGKIASTREVAAFLRNLFGHELNERRAQIRAWLEEPGDLGPNDPVTARDALPVHDSAPAAPLVSRSPGLSPAKVDPLRSMRDPAGGLVGSGPPTMRPESVTLPRQLVGSLDPIFFEDPISLPMIGPSRRTRMLLLLTVALALLGGLLFAFTRRRGPAGAPPSASSSVNQGSGDPAGLAR